MSNVDHIVLYLLLFSFFFFWGKNISRVENKYIFWLNAFVPILIYSFIVGSRYGWGPDYIFYKYRLEHAFTYPEEQIGFKLLNQAIDLLGINYVGGYITYSLVFAICAFILIRSFGKEGIYMYGFLIPATLQFVSSAIRQGLAMGFVLLAIYFFNKRSWFALMACIWIGSTIHSAILVTVVMIAGIYFLIKKPINWKISITLYIFFTFIFESSSVGILSDFLQKYIVLDNKFQSYIDTADVWFSSEAANNELYEQSTVALILSSLFYISTIYLGYFALKYRPNPHIIYLYNSTVFGIILYRVIFLFEILRRLVEPLIMLNFIILGFSIYTFVLLKLNKSTFSKDDYLTLNSHLRMYRFCFILISSYLVLFWGRFIFLNPTAIFFWNL